MAGNHRWVLPARGGRWRRRERCAHDPACAPGICGRAPGRALCAGPCGGACMGAMGRPAAPAGGYDGVGRATGFRRHHPRGRRTGPGGVRTPPGPLAPRGVL